MHPGRVTIPERPGPRPGRPGGHHQRVGELVQHRTADAPPRPAALRPRPRPNTTPGPAWSRHLAGRL